MNLLANITSGDPHRIWQSVCAIRRLRNKEELTLLTAHLDEIKKNTKNISLGGMLRPNHRHLQFALKKLEFIKHSNQCLCALYLLDNLYNPVQEDLDGNIWIINTVTPKSGWVEYYQCECVLCHTEYSVEEHHYHYPWWAWKKAKKFV